MELTDFLLARIAEDERRWGNPAFAPVAGVGLSELVGKMRAECEAKRRIVQACTAELSGRDIEGAMMDGDDGPWLADHITRFLALPYADHPDFREEWGV